MLVACPKSKKDTPTANTGEVYRAIYQHVLILAKKMPDLADGLQSIYKLLSQTNDKFFATGDLYFGATVDPAGQVQEVKISQSPSKEMAQFASNLLPLIKFKPAKCVGQACTMEFPVRVTFIID